MPQSWPSTIPDPQGEYAGKFTNGLSEENGLNFVWRKRRVGDIETNVTWYLSATQWTSFKYFFDTTLKGGSDWFSADWLVDIDSEALFARFTKDGYNADLDEILWVVDATLEIIR